MPVSMDANVVTRYTTLPSRTAVVVAATAILAGVLRYYSVSLSSKGNPEYRKIPVAKDSVPYLGHLYSYLYACDIPAIQMAQRNMGMGPILRFDMGCKTWVVVSDAGLAHELLNVHGTATSHRPKHSYGNRLQSSEHGVSFSQPGPRWKKAKAALTQYVSPKGLVTRTDILDMEADSLVSRLLSDESPVGVLKPLQLSTLNVTLMLCFGQRIEHLDDPLFHKLDDLIQVSAQHADPTYDWRAFLPLPMAIVDWWHQRTKKLTWYMTEVRTPIIQQMIRQGLDGDRECLAKKLYDMKDNDIDDETVLSTCFDLVVAGTDTTALQLAWTLLILCNHPDAQFDAQAEIDAFAESQGRLPSFDDRDHLPLLMSIQKECVRLRPVAPLGLSRQVVTDVTCRGYFIPKGTTVCANVFAMHHDPNVHCDPYQFRAGRFLEKPRRMSTLAGAKVEERDQFVFGWGRRLCPGIHLAEVEFFNITVRLLARATIEPPLNQQGHPVYPDINAFLNGGAVIIPAQDTLRFVRRKNPLNL